MPSHPEARWIYQHSVRQLIGPSVGADAARYSGCALYHRSRGARILNKGQRSVKGLTSGFEDVATLDLVITMVASDSPPAPLRHISKEDVTEATRRLARTGNATTPSHLYLELLRTGIRDGWMLTNLT